MSVTEFLTFASDAELVGLWGVGFILLALISLVLERSRIRRERIDKVGWVPWTGIFLTCAVIGAALVALAAQGLLKG